MVDLKIMVDSIDGAQDSVTDMLARLRYPRATLANVMRHSGASRVEVSCRVDEAARILCLEIRDNGRSGADGSSDEHGNDLQGMRRRAALVGGQLCIESPPGAGTRLELCVPITSRTGQSPTPPLR